MFNSESAVYLHFTQFIYMFGFLWYSENPENLSWKNNVQSVKLFSYLEEMDTN